MQFYAENGYSLGVRGKSYHSTFSKNSESRLKKEVTYSQHKKRKQEEINQNPYNTMRIQINSGRGYTEPFLNFYEFIEIIESVDLQGDKLYHFLTQYDLNKSIDDNIDDNIDELI